MAGKPSGEKTELATPQKLREARKNGDIPSSPEMISAVGGLVAFITLQQQGGNILEKLKTILTADLTVTGRTHTLNIGTLSLQARNDVTNAMLMLLPVVMSVAISAIAVGFFNTRGHVSLKGMKPSGRRLNIKANAKRIFAKEGLAMLIKFVVKLSLAAWIIDLWSPTWQTLTAHMPFMTTVSVASTVWADVIQVIIQISAVYFLIGMVDYGYRFLSWKKRLKMTKQEVKDENKQNEGNPQMKSRMRQAGRRRLRDLMRGNGLRRVPVADVIITNPTHYAIAIQYTVGTMRAPKVIAKGQNLIALRIRELAKQHNIPIVENKPLAQALYKSVDLEREIPASLYHAVAQVLAFVYRMKNPPKPKRRPVTRPSAMRNRQPNRLGV